MRSTAVLGGVLAGEDPSPRAKPLAMMVRVPLPAVHGFASVFTMVTENHCVGRDVLGRIPEAMGEQVAPPTDGWPARLANSSWSP